VTHYWRRRSTARML